MLLALAPTGERIIPIARSRAICPICRSEVRAKCGKIYCHHWAHISGKDCDYWSEPESEWHLNWKSYFPSDKIEVTLIRNEERHRADIVGHDGTVIELQHSPISTDTILKRESFYKGMIWIFDMSHDFIVYRFRNLGKIIETEYHHLGIDKYWSRNVPLTRKDLIDGVEFSFIWKRSRKSLLACKEPFFFDFGKKMMLRVTHLDEHGWGKGFYIDKAKFISKYLGTDIYLY